MSKSSQDRRQTIKAAFAGYKKSFPQVPDITPAELNELQHANPADLAVVDTRTPEEQKVSMLPGAVRQQDFEQQIAERERSKPVVTYCTAGLRSGKYAAQLLQQGFTDVRNLQGSLVSWTHEGLPLVSGTDGRPVKRVHAYGKQWADMVSPDYETVTFKQPLLRGVLDTVKGYWPFK